MGLIARGDMLQACFPVAVYWGYSALYELTGVMDKYRLHPREEQDSENLVSKREVVKVVLRNQAIQVAFSLFCSKAFGGGGGGKEGSATAPVSSSRHPYLLVAAQLAVALFVVDFLVFFFHWCMHINKFLYKHVHSIHHRMVVPYSFGSAYGHPLDSFLVDTLGSAAAIIVSGLPPPAALALSTAVIVKTVDDHCSCYVPWNPLHRLFVNNAAFHDTHHQLSGNKFNFSQTFFVFWDKVFGTYSPHTVEKRPEGGFASRLCIKSD